jgi:hypothetical protein
MSRGVSDYQRRLAESHPVWLVARRNLSRREQTNLLSIFVPYTKLQHIIDLIAVINSSHPLLAQILLIFDVRAVRDDHNSATKVMRLKVASRGSLFALARAF